MAKAKIGRIAFRSEGQFWNAYWVPSQTSMDGAALLGSVRLDLVERSEEAKKLFMEAMQSAFSAALEEVIGETPQWGNPRSAPESERGGNA